MEKKADLFKESTEAVKEPVKEVKEVNNVFVAKGGKFYSPTGWRVNTDFAFKTKEDLHNHMEQVNGFKCTVVNDEYSGIDTRFTNTEQKYGYDIITLEIKEG